MQSKPGDYSQYQTPENLQGCLAVNYTQESLQWFVNKKKSHPNFFQNPFQNTRALHLDRHLVFIPLITLLRTATSMKMSNTPTEGG